MNHGAIHYDRECLQRLLEDVLPEPLAGEVANIKKLKGTDSHRKYMKNATFRILGFQTLSLRTCVAILGLSLSPAILSAHEKSPAAKQLSEQLQAQESAAATQAATIRKLQTSRLAEQFKMEIAGHQRELKNLLGTAFDLKLQLEELQVQELQSRLSRLERQIGQRKELREKIIARRASELIDGDDLKWSSIATPKSREQLVTVPDGGTAVVRTPPAARTTGGKSEVTASQAINRGGKDEKVTVDLYGGAKVLPRISQTPKHGKLLQSLNAMTGVVTNFREVKVDDETIIVTAIVRDPSRPLDPIHPIFSNRNGMSNCSGAAGYSWGSGCGLADD